MGSVAVGDVTLKDAPDSQVNDDVVPKIEPGQDGYDSPSASSLEGDQEAEPAQEKSSADPPPPPKRKGGRKPVRVLQRCVPLGDVSHSSRSMLLRKSGSRGTVKHKQLSVNVELNTSSSWSKQSNIMKKLSRTCSKAIGKLLMSA